MQKARRRPKKGAPTACGRMVSGSLFTPLPGVLFTFPSRYWFAIGLSVVFSLAGWCRQLHTGFLRSRATQDARWPCTRAGYGALTPCGPPFQDGSPTRASAVRGSYNPAGASTPAVWAPPRSLTTTWGITVVFLSSGYLDVSVPRVRLPCGIALAGWVAPFGHPRIAGHLRLPAAFRSLSRPSSPPRAKASTIRP